MPDDIEPIAPEDLKNWANDQRGTGFWQKIREEFAAKNAILRGAAREGKMPDAAFSSGYMEALEDVLNLPEMMIQDIKEKQEEK